MLVHWRIRILFDIIINAH
jgi:hypothetical protein